MLFSRPIRARAAAETWRIRVVLPEKAKFLTAKHTRSKIKSGISYMERCVVLIVAIVVVVFATMNSYITCID